MRILSVILILAVGLTGCAVEANPTSLPAATDPVQLPTLATRTAIRPSAAAQTPARTPTPGVTSTVKASDLRGARVSFWFQASGDLAEEVLAQVAEFNRANVWGISVEGRAFPTSAQLDEQVQAARKTGEMPQVVTAPMEMLLGWQAADGRLVDLEGYIHDGEWGMSAQEVYDFWPVFWQSGQSGGKRYGIPAGRNVQVLFYNQSWGEALGFSQPPASPADFRTQACAAMKANVADSDPGNDGTGGWIVTDDPLSLESWRMAFGGDALPTAEGQPYHFNTQPAVKAYSFLRKLLDDNCAWNARDPNPYTYFAQHQALFYSGSLLDLPFQERAMAFAKSSDRWRVLAYPTESRGSLSLTSGANYAVLQSSAVNQLASWLLIRNFMLPRVQARLAAASGLFPARGSALDLMKDYFLAHPQWTQATGWKEQLQPAPQLASWRSVRRVLQDASWQIFSPITRLDGIPAVLTDLDSMAAEVVKAKP